MLLYAGHRGAGGRFAATGLPWPLPPEIDQIALEARLFAPSASSAIIRPLPDWGTIHQELQRKGVTLQLLSGNGASDNPGAIHPAAFGAQEASLAAADVQFSYASHARSVIEEGSHHHDATPL